MEWCQSRQYLSSIAGSTGSLYQPITGSSPGFRRREQLGVAPLDPDIAKRQVMFQDMGEGEAGDRSGFRFAGAETHQISL